MIPPVGLGRLGVLPRPGGPYSPDCFFGEGSGICAGPLVAALQLIPKTNLDSSRLDHQVGISVANISARS